LTSCEANIGSTIRKLNGQVTRCLSDGAVTMARPRRLVLALALVVAVLGAAGVAYGVDLTVASASGQINSGTVTIALGDTGSSTNRLTVAATNLDPTVTPQDYRSFDLANTGTVGLSAVSLTVSATSSSALNTDTVNGVQMAISRCSVPWTESGTAPNLAYACSGTTSSVLATRPVIGTGIALANLTSTSPGATDHLVLTLSLPSTSPSADQGLTSTLSLVFTGTQRGGQSS
jgi:spore coat-associated protein N